MSSYYDDPDFAGEYRWRDEMAIDAALRERELDQNDRLPLHLEGVVDADRDPA